MVDDKGNWTGAEADQAETEALHRTDHRDETWFQHMASLSWRATGRVDVAANCFAITEARLKTYIASDPIYADAQVIIVQPDSEYQTLDDLRGHTIGVTAGQAAQTTR
ncbi:MAG: transporter substrate-binding domain-containing protein [Enterocloster sp.]